MVLKYLLGGQEEKEEEGLDEEWEEFTEDGGGGEDVGWGEGWGEGEENLEEVEGRLCGGEDGAVEEELGWSLAGTHQSWPGMEDENGGGDGWRLGGSGEGEGGEGGWTQGCGGAERREMGEREKGAGGWKLGGHGERRERGLKSSTNKPLRRGSDHGKSKERRDNKAENGQRKEGEEHGWARSTLSEADRQRLEEQATWSTEPDLFADMAPAIAKSNPSSSLRLGIHGGTQVSMSTEKTKSSLQYHPPENEVREYWCVCVCVCVCVHAIVFFSSRRKEVAGMAGMTSNNIPADSSFMVISYNFYYFHRQGSDVSSVWS